MATSESIDATDADATPNVAIGTGAPKSYRKKLIIIVGLVALVLGGVGAAYATGLLSKLTGKNESQAAATMKPGAVDLPEIVANLNAGARRNVFVRIKARLELANKTDEAAVTAAEPRVQDLFQTYLRDLRPEELRGSAGTYRLREELIARANIAVAPARITEILFVQLLMQ